MRIFGFAGIIVPFILFVRGSFAEDATPPQELNVVSRDKTLSPSNAKFNSAVTKKPQVLATSG